MRERERERRRRGKEGLETAAAAAAAGAAPRAGDRKCARAQFSPFPSLSPSLLSVVSPLEAPHFVHVRA